MRHELEPAAIVRAAESDLFALAARINAEHEAGEKATRKSLEHYRNAGAALLQAKAKLKEDAIAKGEKGKGHGSWLPWLKENVRFSQRTAWKYMQVAEHWDKLEPGSNLTDALSLLSADADPDDDRPDQPETFDAPAGRETPLQPLPDVRDDPPEFQCETCGESFAKDVWHCQSCHGHWPRSQDTCPNCPMPADEAPSRRPLPTTDPRPTPKQAEAVTLAQWNEMGAAERRRVLRDVDGAAKLNDQGDNENIEWALWSWNPVTGCLHNCPYCYARDIANRFYPQKFEPSLIPSRLKAPHNTPFPREKAAEWVGHKNVFTCSMADLFGRWVPAEWIEAVLAEVRKAKQWNFLFLTKFPTRMAEFDFPSNAWVGTTVDCQARVANAEKAFRKIKAGVKWLSIEPLIEPLKFNDLAAFQWIVIGGSSKSSQTPEWKPPLRWVIDLEESAANAGVPYYEKSNLGARVNRIRQYPGDRPHKDPDVAPESLRYLPTVGN